MINESSTSELFSSNDGALSYRMPFLLEGNKLSLSRRGIERIDLLLIVLESLDLNASQAMVWSIENLGLSNQIPNSVELWKRRCHNPLRRTVSRGSLNSDDCAALVNLTCSMSERLYPIIRQLLSSRESKSISRERWQLFKSRFRELIRDRLNPARGAVKNLLVPEKSDELIRQLLITLSICVGFGGFERLCASLQDFN